MKPLAPSRPSIFRLRPLALRLMLGGHFLILLALCDFAARLYAGESLEPILYASEFMRSVSVAFALLWGAGLGINFLEAAWGLRRK